MAEKEYIDREAFLTQKREQYCKDCARRKGMRNGKYKTLYEIGEAPCRACEINDVLNDVEDFPAADVRPVEWIPVTERLPENDQDVLVMVHWRDYPENMMCYGRKYKTRWYLWNGELGELIKGFDITHWMPLPQPPKEE